LLTGLCGDNTYTIVDNADDAAISNWAVIADSTNNNGKMMITIDPSLYGSHIASDTTITIKVTTKFADWATNSGSTSTIAVTL